MSLLCLDAKYSSSPFGGQHRTILISKDFSNSSDFVFNSLLQHFGRKEPNTPVLVVTLSHDWSNYSASAAKCGFNLRRSQNRGNFEVLNVMSKFLESIKIGDQNFNLCDYIIESISNFTEKYTSDLQSDSDGVRVIKPIVILIDDLSILSSLGCNVNDIYRLVSLVDRSLRNRSKELQAGNLSHLILQTMTTNLRFLPPTNQFDSSLNYLVSNIENISELSITLKPLDTGYSTRVDGTIKIVDNRLPSLNQPSSCVTGQTPLFQDSAGDIGLKKAYFYKLGDRRVRLTSSALIF